MPNADLARYFESVGVSLDIDLSEIKDSDSEAIFQAFLGLPEEQQSVIEADFQNINALAFDGGVKVLVDEAAFHEKNDSFAKAIAEIKGLHSKVMWAFLEHKDYWRGASMFLHADNISPSFWKKCVGIPPAPPCVENADINELAQAISHFFHTKEGKGRNCKVDVYRRYNREYFFAYPEGFAQSTVEWVSNTLETRTRHPAFEIIFVYCEDENSLDICAPKNTKVIPVLQRLFAKAILKLDSLPDGGFHKPVYTVESLQDSKFEFTKPPSSEIKDIVVTHLRLTLAHGGKRNINLTADTKGNAQAVYDLLDELTLPAYSVSQVGVSVSFEATADRRANKRTFNITPPHGCALGYDGQDGEIREMLALSGIEPGAVSK